MAVRLSSAQRWLLSECVRGALVGWLLTDPNASRESRRFQHETTTFVSFSFSRFVKKCMVEFGPDYCPRSPASGCDFPLSILEAASLANNIELEYATDDELYAAALIAAASPYGQPAVGSRDWRTYVAAMEVMGLFLDEDRPDWRQNVRNHLRPFYQAVASAHAVAAE